MYRNKTKQNKFLFDGYTFQQEIEFKIVREKIRKKLSKLG